MPIVSVILPAYNAAGTVARAIRSVQGQTLTDWELVVIDDGSADGTVGVVEGFAALDPRIRLTRQENGGAAAARNAGLQQARGEWIQFLDADDELEPDHLEAMHEVALAHPDVGLVHCGWRRMRHGQEWWTTHPASDMADPFLVSARTCPFAIHAALTRRDAMQAAGAFDPALRVCEDWDLWQRIARMGTRFKALPGRMVDVHVQPGSLSSDMTRHLGDGLDVIRRGHHADPRVAAAPAHAQGAPAEGLAEAIWYHALWVIGSAIGRGSDPAPLLRQIPEALPAGLDPATATTVIEDALVVGSFGETPPWPSLWPQVEAGILALARELDARGPEQGLGEEILTRLSNRVLQTIDDPAPRTIGNARIEAIDLADGIPDLDLPGCKRLRCVVTLEGEELCRFERLVFEGASGLSLAADIRSLVDTPETRRKLAAIRLRQGPLRRWGGQGVAPEKTLRLWKAALRTKLKPHLPLYSEALDLLYDAKKASPGTLRAEGRFNDLVAAETGKAREAARLAGIALADGPPQRSPRDGPPPAANWSPFPILMYHRISDDGPAALDQWRTSQMAFAEQLGWLSHNGYTPVSLRRMSDAVLHGHALPERSLVITFDDATRDFQDIALPLLERHGFPATLFVPTGHVGDAARWDALHGPPTPLLDWNELAALPASLVTIGSHSVNHLRLPELGPEALVRELAGSKAALEARLGREIDSIAYPFGAYDSAVRLMTRRCGYRTGLTCLDGLVEAQGDALALRRQEVKGGMSLAEFARLLGHPAEVEGQAAAAAST